MYCPSDLLNTFNKSEKLFSSSEQLTDLLTESESICQPFCTTTNLIQFVASKDIDNKMVHLNAPYFPISAFLYMVRNQPDWLSSQVFGFLYDDMSKIFSTFDEIIKEVMYKVSQDQEYREFEKIQRLAANYYLLNRCASWAYEDVFVDDPGKLHLRLSKSCHGVPVRSHHPREFFAMRDAMKMNQCTISDLHWKSIVFRVLHDRQPVTWIFTIPDLKKMDKVTYHNSFLKFTLQDFVELWFEILPLLVRRRDEFQVIMTRDDVDTYLQGSVSRRLYSDNGNECFLDFQDYEDHVFITSSY